MIVILNHFIRKKGLLIKRIEEEAADKERWKKQPFISIDNTSGVLGVLYFCSFKAIFQFVNIWLNIHIIMLIGTCLSTDAELELCHPLNGMHFCLTSKDMEDTQRTYDTQSILGMKRVSFRYLQSHISTKRFEHSTNRQWHVRRIEIKLTAWITQSIAENMRFFCKTIDNMKNPLIRYALDSKLDTFTS